MNFIQRLKHETIDIGENVKNIFAPNQKPVADAKVLSDGSVSHNIDLAEYTGTELLQAEELINKTVHAIEDLEAKADEASANGDAELASHYRTQVQEARVAFTQLKWELEHRDLDVATFSGGLLVAPVVNAIRDPFVQDRIADGYETVAHLIGTEDVVLDVQSLPLDEAGGASAAAGTDGSAAAAWGAFEGKSAAELAAAFEDDPQAFFESLKGLQSEERGAILMMVQGEIQQTNQLFSMLSNFQSAQHDTQKAMISNLRV